MFGASLSEEATALDDALSFANIAAQHAPAGHPIFAAIQAAEQTERDVRALIPWYSTGTEEASGAIVAMVNAARDQIFDAAADIRNDPDAPLAPTIWDQVRKLPWPWIGAGAAAVAVTLVYFRKKGRR